ncbi:DUF3618 domain-containing protein [Demequina flava]|uniref:DUF3618 domain-containing protein n=1 Tax=Demequina flava TaxID=1095025 RepID=UPI000782A86E
MSDSTSPEPDPRSAHQIERDLEQTRESLEATLEELGTRLDVKSRAADWMQNAQMRTKHLVTRHPREISVAAGGVALSVIAFVIAQGRKP